MSWRIVEQVPWVEAGRREFADGTLSFHFTLAEAIAAGPVQVVLLSSVLPYLESPHALLAAVAAHQAPHIVIDRTSIVAGACDRLVVQATPPWLGGGSYPCWLFNRERLLAPLLAGGYELAGEWQVPDRLARQVEHRGFHLRRRT